MPAISALPVQAPLLAPSPQQGRALASVSGRPHWRQKHWLHAGNAPALPVAAASAAERAGADGPGAACPLAGNSGGAGQAPGPPSHPTGPAPSRPLHDHWRCPLAGGVATAPVCQMPPPCTRTH